MLKESQLSHVAEVYLGGILEQLPSHGVVDPDYIRYDFIEGVRELLLDTLPTSESVEVAKNVSDFVAERVGQFLDFRALLADPTSISTIEMVIDENSRSFATIEAKVLRRLGGQYVAVANSLEEALSTTALSTQTVRKRTKASRKTSANAGIAPRVFISYARTDGEPFATKLRQQLEAEHIPLWQNRVGLEGGKDWWLQITEALEKVEFLVIVMTPAAMLSEAGQRPAYPLSAGTHPVHGRRLAT